MDKCQNQTSNPNFSDSRGALSIRGIFPPNPALLYTCWSLSPINLWFIACQNYFWNWASRLHGFSTCRVQGNIQFISGGVKWEPSRWCSSSKGRTCEWWKFKLCLGLLEEPFTENRSFGPVSIATLNKQEPAHLAKMLLASGTHRTSQPNVRSWAGT